MSKLEDELSADEKIIWRGKPDKKKYLSSVSSGIVVAAFVTIFAVYTIAVKFYLGTFIAISVIVALILVPRKLLAKRLLHIEYMITNQRLLIKKGRKKEDIVTINLDDIYDVVKKFSSLYPITAEYPYQPKGVEFQEGNDYDEVEVFNIVENKYEKLARIERYEIDKARSQLKSLLEPSVVKKLLKESIQERRKDLVSCKYCHAFVDLNKGRKCSKCGRLQPKDDLFL